MAPPNCLISTFGLIDTFLRLPVQLIVRLPLICSESGVFIVQVRALCEKAKEILMEESNVQVCRFVSLRFSLDLNHFFRMSQNLLFGPGFVHRI